MIRRGVALLVIALALPASAVAAIGLTATPTSATASAVTLNGDDQSSTFSETLAITGVTQSLGYNVTAWAPLPTVSGQTLGALSAGAPTLSCTQGGCTAGTNGVTGYPLTLGTTSGTAVKILNAIANSANKNQQAIVTFTIPVTADELPGTYTTTLTLTVANGP